MGPSSQLRVLKVTPLCSRFWTALPQHRLHRWILRATTLTPSKSQQGIRITYGVEPSRGRSENIQISLPIQYHFEVCLRFRYDMWLHSEYGTKILVSAEVLRYTLAAQKAREATCFGTLRLELPDAKEALEFHLKDLFRRSPSPTRVYK